MEFADPDLFQGAAWLLTPSAGQDVYAGLSGEFLQWIEKIGGRVASMEAAAHDQLCAWISHLPQMISTALAAALVEEYGENAPLLEAGGRALREMTRISASPYSMWRDVALTNKKNIADALLKLEQRLAHIRENLDTKELAMEFELEGAPAAEDRGGEEGVSLLSRVQSKTSFLLPSSIGTSGNP